ncbi:MAG: RNA 2'-phosphotransferase [Candidatus Bathyarchaeota archaeon]|jgi:putative RNA 2'-phosphotransferase
MEQNLKTEVSKYMSYLLRHDPENLKMDRHGFVDLDQLAEKVRERFQVDKKLILEIVEKSDRKRFEIREDKIRATYGHTIAVKLELEEDKTVKLLYHGTTPDAASRILRKGLKPMKRRWVHLSPTIRIAKEVGLRRTRKPVILEIDAEAARKKGARFYKTSDIVYLCNDLSQEFIKLAKTERIT